ncbi:MAG: hypothetical protein V1822_01365 [Candidatus Micrarchaeota archaeon]
MSSIRKTVLSAGREHYIQIDSSLDLEEIEITGSDPVSGKTVHISLSSLLKQPSRPQEVSSSQPMGMFSADEITQEAEPAKAGSFEQEEEREGSDNVINDLFG